MRKIEWQEMSFRATSWATEQVLRNRRNRLAVLYMILADLVGLLFAGIADGESGILAWLVLNVVVLIVYLCGRAILLREEW
ncbi:hypothetical protein LCGC14_2205060 [marine sediment metagenome]|uniref:Uncharacterized protein n=1 Tax=marine sediment metagenome TaxID=412755 RepID=A0A0F9E2V7_9ZZZZ